MTYNVTSIRPMFIVFESEKGLNTKMIHGYEVESDAEKHVKAEIENRRNNDLQYYYAEVPISNTFRTKFLTINSKKINKSIL